MLGSSNCVSERSNDKASNHGEFAGINRDSSEQINATIPHGLIDANGNCLSCCDPHALEVHLTCFWCDHKFHAVCRDTELEDQMVDKKNYDIICVISRHTKSYFHQYKVLTVHGIILLNAFIFIFKIRHSPSTLPLSVRATISEESPVPGSTHISCGNWLKTYNNF